MKANSGVAQLVVEEIRSLATGSPSVKEILDTTESRYGDLYELLCALEWDGADMAYLTHVQNDGTAVPLKHNVMAGQLVTALGSGFLPIPLARWQSENPAPKLAAAEDVRSKTSKRDTQPESPSDIPTTRPTDEELLCEPCERLFNTRRGIARHRLGQSHIRRVAELAASE